MRPFLRHITNWTGIIAGRTQQAGYDASWHDRYFRRISSRVSDFTTVVTPDIALFDPRSGLKLYAPFVAQSHDDENSKKRYTQQDS